MEFVTRTRACPRCGADADITWGQVYPYENEYPIVEVISRFDCSSGCRPPFSDIHAAYPTASSPLQR